MDAKTCPVPTGYFYYLHGSLARVEKGQDNVQGMDFAYTTQGWLKGINSTLLDASHDIGHDGLSTDLDAYSGADVNGFSLGYFKEDYDGIGTTTYFSNTDYLMTENGTYGELFNGNISTMVTAMKDENEALMTTQGNIYRYDLLQRIKGMDTYQVTDVANFNSIESFSAANATTSGMYATTYSFDKNGNITLLTRNDQAGAGMDNFTYNYVNPDENNQLAYVDDALTTAGITVDLEDQASGNYTYDAIGQLTKDVEAEIEDIQWTADGKVRKITFTSTSGKAPIQYVYDAGGNRLVQITGDPDDVSVVYEYYVYDATGNLMATYEQTHQGNLQGTAPADYTEITTLKDRNIYGASRLGSQIENRELYSRHFDLDGSSFLVNQNTVSTETHTDEFDPTRRIMDTKFYEMSNHLGNVLNVVTDRKIGNVTKDGYEADIISYSDYYPYGMLLPNRHGSEDDGYRYGFQGQEMDDEIKGEGNSVNYKYRMHDSRIGRFFAVDPLTAKYPHYSPYSFSGNKVIDHVEMEGLEEKKTAMMRQGTVAARALLGASNVVLDDGSVELGSFEIEIAGVSKNDQIYTSAFRHYQNLFNASSIAPAEMADYTTRYFSYGALTAGLSGKGQTILGSPPNWQIVALSNLTYSILLLDNLGSPNEAQGFHDYIMSRDLSAIKGNAGIYNVFAHYSNRAHVMRFSTVAESSMGIMGAATFGGQLPKPTFKGTSGFGLNYTPLKSGSGPVVGVLEVSEDMKSVKSVLNYNPKGGGVEFVFNPESGRFVVGTPKISLGGSPHVQLNRAIGGNPNTTVGGILNRGPNGQIFTNEKSGHFWQNWTPLGRARFTNFMQGNGVPVNHSGGM